MPHRYKLAILLAATASVAHGADDDALDLQSTPTLAPATEARKLHLTLELAALNATRQGSLGSQNGHRMSADLRWSGTVTESWRFAISDRLDEIQPTSLGQPNTRNHLREAYLSWRGTGEQFNIEAGRYNLRHGTAFGYSPTDYFRSGATRSVVTADPVALRENRTGTFMVRGSYLGSGVGATLAWAPQMTTKGPSNESLTLDLGATNLRHRLLLSMNARASERWSGEALVFLEQGKGARLGANVTGLVSDGAVLHGEWSLGRTPNLLEGALGLPDSRRRYQQASLGLTYTFSGGLAITAEAEYNGGGLNREGWHDLFAQNSGVVYGLFGSTQADQELASRQSWLIYAAQKGVVFKQLDFKGFIRQNALDHSHLMWAELRYHWPRFDAALQWQRSSGSTTSTEFGAFPNPQVIQFVWYMYF